MQGINAWCPDNAWCPGDVRCPGSSGCPHDYTGCPAIMQGTERAIIIKSVLWAIIFPS